MIDLHMHTIYSDGKNSIEEMIKGAIYLGLKKIAITDHIWRSSQWFDNYYIEICKYKKIYSQIDILVGFEAKSLSVNGEIDATLLYCEKSDIRMAAVHRIPKCSIQGEFFSRTEILNNKEASYKNWLQTTENLIKNPYVNVIAHPLMALYRYKIEEKKEDIINLFLLAKKNNTKLEISSRYKKSNLGLLEVLKLYPHLINYVTYGSDSHSIEDLKKAHFNE